MLSCSPLPVSRLMLRLARRRIVAGVVAGLALQGLVAAGCADGDEPRELNATITSASLAVNDALPDSPAGFDATVSLEASGDFDEIRLLGVRATTLPEGADSLTADIAATLQGPQNNATVLSASSGATVVGRLVSAGTTNGELIGWCQRIVAVTAEFEADELRPSARVEVAVTCP